MALLFKDFEHRGMIGDFNDAELLTGAGIGDFIVAAHPGQRRPGARRPAGAHT